MLENSAIDMLPYEALRNAIVVQAAKDYRDAVSTIRQSRKKLCQIQKNMWKEMAIIIDDPYSPEAEKLKKPDRESSRKTKRLMNSIDGAKRTIHDVEKFFDSNWYKTICTVDGRIIMKELRKETEYVEN